MNACSEAMAEFCLNQREAVSVEVKLEEDATSAEVMSGSVLNQKA
mgnify:CR=1 FL=1